MKFYFRRRILKPIRGNDRSEILFRTTAITVMLSWRRLLYIHAPITLMRTKCRGEPSISLAGRTAAARSRGRRTWNSVEPTQPGHELHDNRRQTLIAARAGLLGGVRNPTRNDNGLNRLHRLLAGERGAWPRRFGDRDAGVT